MKTVLLTTLAFLGSATAYGHGSIPQQASLAIESATKLFLKDQPREIKNQFNSVQATVAGHEIFAVRFGLKGANGDGQVTYRCTENEDVTPVIWECKIN